MDVAHFREVGYHVVRGLFAPHEIAAIHETFMEQMKDGPIAGLSENLALSDDDPLARYPRMLFPADHPELAVGSLAMRYMLDGRLRDVLTSLMGEEPIAAQSMFYFKPPGARGQSMHQDNSSLRVRPGTCMAAWIAVDDADEENGGMRVIPGTQDMELICPGPGDPKLYFTGGQIVIPGMDAVPVDLKAGDCLFFNGSLVHGSSPNRSATRFRRSLIFHYIPQNTVELAAFYSVPRRFDGSVVTIAPAEGGGPCGTPAAPP